MKSDIYRARVVLNKIVTQDSIAKLLLWNKITRDEMFLDEKKSYGIVFHDDFTLTISDNSYVNFQLNLKNIPTKYDTISSNLKSLYGTLRVPVEAVNERIRSTVIENLDKINTYDWNVESEKGFMPEEGKNYFQRDLEYKKVLLKYMNGIENVFMYTQIFEQEAISVHNEISKILGVEDFIYSSPNFKSSLDSLQEKYFNGKYKLQETVNPNFWPEIIELKEIDNKLHILAEKWPEFRYYSNDKTTFL